MGKPRPLPPQGAVAVKPQARRLLGSCGSRGSPEDLNADSCSQTCSDGALYKLDPFLWGATGPRDPKPRGGGVAYF